MLHNDIFCDTIKEKDTKNNSGKKKNSIKSLNVGNYIVALSTLKINLQIHIYSEYKTWFVSVKQKQNKKKQVLFVKF